MSSFLNKIYLISIIEFYISAYCTSEEYGTCDQTFHIFKNTQASSDSERECINGFNIFPYIEDEGANKFHDGACAYQCKLQLPDTCFSIHAPQTMQHDEGLLAIHILEKKMTEKWQHVLDDAYPYEYDAFFDYNMGFWVRSLDDYIHHWYEYEDETLQLHELEYFGIEWNVNIDYEDIHFYSILIHSPFSSINYEFMSQSKPSNDLYTNMKWITSEAPRCTFAAMNDPFPWNRDDAAIIVPVRLSHAVANIDAMYDFYVNVMGGKLVQNSHRLQTDIDSEQVESFAVQLINTQIELQFIKRPQYHTYGDLTVDVYEKLLVETHTSIITSPYCGIDRWFDNHFGYLSFGVDGFMDAMIDNIEQRQMVYRVYKLSYEHSSVLMKQQLDKYGYITQYGAIVIDPSGQSIEVNGHFYNTKLQQFAPVANPQWCTTPCAGYMMQGFVDQAHVYHDDEVDIVDNINIVNDLEIADKDHKDALSLFHLVIIIFGSIFVISCVLSIVYCCCQKMNCCRRKKKHKNRNFLLYDDRNENTPLI